MNSDLLYVLTSRLDNNALQRLSLAGLWDQVRSFALDKFWWYLRSCHLFRIELAPRPGSDWRQAYPHLEQIVRELATDPGSESRALCLACHCPLAMEVLIELGYDPSDGNSAALLYAAQGGHIDVVKLLLEDGRSDPSTGDNWPLVKMITENEIEWVQKLLSDPRIEASCAAAS